jgi:hypothetical protein
MEDLKTTAGRLAAIQNLEVSFIRGLRYISNEIADDAVCKICSDSIVLGIAATGAYMEKGFKRAFASDITFYPVINKTANEINYGSYGSFAPANKESYWRTIHAAAVLKNWDAVCELVNEHCEAYRELVEEIMKVNEVALNNNAAN